MKHLVAVGVNLRIFARKKILIKHPDRQQQAILLTLKIQMDFTELQLHQYE